MGVPKFYRWISERYPCLSETVKEFQIPEFDNLYLDMNGIVHVCSHPEDDNPHFRITEERIFKDIFHYIEFIFRMIKPKKVFFMAIDGVAPRAKMNQQRGRRFRSAREAEDLIKRAEMNGEVLPTEKRFDSNCITPGTPFMVRLQEALKYFVVQKIGNDPLWQGPRIFLSGHETPGEGEHKVMDFIRYEKSKPGYDSNTRHCLYGLDADLIMLGLTSHEPHFSLLREEVRFGGKKDQNKRPATPEETTFHLLHLSLLREYIDYEFASVKPLLSFPYSLENIIDDWILMGFLVGNDFIPHLPYLHIKNDALPMLWQTYMQVLPTLDGYINEGGHLNLKRFETYITTLAKFDIESFSDQFTDIKWMESKVGNKHINEYAGRAAKEEQQKKEERQKKMADLSPFAAFSMHEDSEPSDDPSTDPSIDKTDDEDDDFDTFDAEFRQHKRNYYMDKLEYENVTADVLEDQAKGYVLAIQWILLYYFEGVPSWGWFYPHHYAPFISDVKNFSDMKIEFDYGTPFLPFQQLMAVLPAASKDLLPKPLQTLMIMDTSPVIDFYPQDFKTDLNGKQQEWEAVVLIPFIEEKRLLDAMDTQYKYLSKEEISRNKHGPCLMYQHSVESQGVYVSPLPLVFPDIGANHSKLTEIPITEYIVDPNKLRKGLMDGVKLDVYFPGFPTLKHIPHKAHLSSDGVKVFQQSSRGQNMMLDIIPNPVSDIELVVKDLLGKTTYVGWPHLYEAKVVSIMDGAVKYDLVEESPSKGKKSKSPRYERRVQDLTRDEAQIFYRTVDNIKERYHDRHGVNIGITSLVINACPMTGRKYACGSHGKITLEKQFSTQPVAFAYQATIQNISVHDPAFCQFMTMEELFPAESPVFMLGSPHYGSQGQVVEVDIGEGRVRVNFTILLEPDIEKILQNQQGSSSYMPGFVAAQRLAINTHFLSRITGTIFLQRGSPDNLSNGKVNIGLNLKFSKRGMEVPGYTKKSEDGWLYSQKAVDTVGKYIEKFQELCDFLSNSDNNSSDMYSAYEIFGDDCGEKIKEIEAFIKALPCSAVAPIKSGSDMVDEHIVKAIEEEATRIHELNKKKERCIKMQVKPHLLYRPIISLGPIMPDPSARFELFDRIVISKQGYAVPFGLRGTVVGVHPAEKEMDVLYDVVFDEEFVGGIEVRCSKNRGYRVPCFTMINLTYGDMKEKGKLHLRDQTSGTNKSENNSRHRENKPLKYGIRYSEGSNRGGRADSYPRKGYDNNQLGYNQSPRNAWGNSNQGQGGNRGQDNRQVKIFNNEGYDVDFPSGSHPQFVTPKVNSAQRAPPRKTYADLAGNRGRSQQQSWTGTSDSEFSDMWSQLQAKSPQKSTTVEPPNQTEEDRGPSLIDAAKALNKLTPPAGSPNVKIIEKSSDSVPNANNSNPVSNSTKIDLNRLFDSVGNKKVVVSDEFSSHFNSLSLAADSAKQTEIVDSSPNENTSEYLKQHITSSLEESPPDSSALPNPKSYGTQLSLKELFDSAKESSVSPSQQQNGTSNRNKPPTHHSSHQHNQSQSRHPIDTSRNTRKPVEDLHNLCVTMFKQPPKYDINTIGQNSHQVFVTIPNMGRFNGASCATKEEARASAASIALLRMGGAGAAFTRFPGFHGNQGTRQLFSPNSAFSPVLPGAQPMGNQMGNQMPHPFHMPVFPRHPFAQQPGYPNPQGYRQMGNFNMRVNFNQRPQANQYPGNNPHIHTVPNQHASYNQRDQHSNHRDQHSNHRDSNPRNNVDISSSTDSTSNPFIPLQVTKKQKTPQKRHNSGEHHATAEFSETRTSTEETKTSTVSNRPQNSKPVTSKTPKSDQHQKQKHTASRGQKGRRPRIAANLNFENCA
ncbi:hypothetical protein SNE40_015305 [Patella caerulea]|uniref:Uncharacterized protein n=1 Tax=Patella caerulea TaxID=87958 RepID=A0AAN8JJY3_PATCE